jgi:hypothetical protein
VAPTADSAQFAIVQDGLRLEVRTRDEAPACGITSVQASIVGPGIRLFLDVDLEKEEDGLWVADLPADRCATAGEVRLGGLSLRDAGGNERDFRTAMGETFLQAIDADVELPVQTGQLEAYRDLPEVIEVVVTGPGRIEVAHTGGDCGQMSGWVRAKDPDGVDIRLDHVGTVSAGREAFAIGGTECLAEGTYQVHEVVVAGPFGGGLVVTDLAKLPTFEITGTGLTESLPLVVKALRMEPQDADTVRVIVDLEDASCPVASMSGHLRALAEGDTRRRVARFGDDGLATLAPCSGDGQWWLAKVTLSDVSGGVWPYRLRTDDPSKGYREDPALDPPTLVSPFQR